MVISGHICRRVITKIAGAQLDQKRNILDTFRGLGVDANKRETEK